MVENGMGQVMGGERIHTTHLWCRVVNEKGGPGSSSTLLVIDHKFDRVPFDFDL